MLKRPGRRVRRRKLLSLSPAERMRQMRERGVQLRQATPFMAVLTAYERRKIYDAFRVVKRRLDAASRT